MNWNETEYGGCKAYLESPLQSREARIVQGGKRFVDGFSSSSGQPFKVKWFRQDNRGNCIFQDDEASVKNSRRGKDMV